MKWLKQVKNLITSAISLENETGVGKYNLIWARYTFIVYLLSLLTGTGINYTTIAGSNPLNGFELKIGGTDFSLMTLIMCVTPIICVLLLLYCWKIGLVDSSFKPKK